MTGKEAYEIWAPAGGLWSPWVAPAFFAGISCKAGIPEQAIVRAEPAWMSQISPQRAAILVDLSGPETITAGLALARMGFRPVPIINAAPGSKVLGEGWTSGIGDTPVVDMQSLVDALCVATRAVQSINLDPHAPPAFLLDSRRLSTSQAVRTGMFDNRWMVFPEDFPSAQKLKHHNILSVLVIQPERRQPQEDLAHVLRRWQENGIQILALDAANPAPAQGIQINRPSRYRALWYRALAIMGLRRNSAGGFGSVVPDSSSAG